MAKWNNGRSEGLEEKKGHSQTEKRIDQAKRIEKKKIEILSGQISNEIAFST